MAKIIIISHEFDSSGKNIHKTMGNMYLDCEHLRIEQTTALNVKITGGEK